MVIASLALDGLDNKRANIDPALLGELANLALGLLSALDHIGFALRVRQRKIDARTRHARPIEFCEQIRLTRIGIGKAHGVAASPVKCMTKMQDLGSAFAVTSSHVLPHFPIHRCLQTILDRERAALDKKVALQRRQPDYTFK